MRHLLRSAAGFAVALSASAALAQNAAKPPITVRTQETQPRVREVQKVPEQPAAPAVTESDGRSMRATNLIGTDLVLDNGDTFGRVNDLIIDSQTSQVAYAIVETDQDYRPIPFKALVLQTGAQPTDRYFYIGMDRDRIMQAPSIQRTEYQSYSVPQWNTQWQTYQPRVTQFYSNVNTRVPANFQRTTRHEVNAAERKIDQGVRKANRKLD
ncbi:MAG TPA: PRC-barrel domain-containing protein [Caulifigura sp.]|jgi:sporulation protein YlmC with PRC-barrel domain|nr:PRC-barrel domain-containing protein [Caulifigura sp.]